MLLQPRIGANRAPPIIQPPASLFYRYFYPGVMHKQSRRLRVVAIQTEMCIINIVSKLKVNRRYKASDVGKVINLIGHHAGRYFSVSYRVNTQSLYISCTITFVFNSWRFSDYKTIHRNHSNKDKLLYSCGVLFLLASKLHNFLLNLKIT